MEHLVELKQTVLKVTHTKTSLIEFADHARSDVPNAQALNNVLYNVALNVQTVSDQQIIVLPVLQERNL